MSEYREQFQFTFRVIGTHMQFPETDYTEATARETLARIMLRKNGIDESASDYDQLLADYMANKLRLVYFR